MNRKANFLLAIFLNPEQVARSPLKNVKGKGAIIPLVNQVSMLLDKLLPALSKTF
jgi:hypothetical protein